MILIEIDYQKEKSKETLFPFGTPCFESGEIVKIDFNKLIVNENIGFNDFLKFKEKIYSRAIIKESYIVKNTISYIGNNIYNQDSFYESKYYIIQWENGDLMYLTEEELGKFVKDV